MKRTTVLVAALVFAMLNSAQGEQAKATSLASLDTFKKLEGEWVLTEPEEGKEGLVEFEYKVLSKGLAVMETYHPGRETEEITIYYEDGGDLLLTHYCSLGSHPRMRAVAGRAANMLSFSLVDIANLESQSVPHLSSMQITFIDSNTIHTRWGLYKDGKEIRNFPATLKRVDG